MKTFSQFLPVILSAIILTSCGGNGGTKKVTTNKYLGKIPSLVQNYQIKDSVSDATYDDKSEKATKMDDAFAAAQKREKEQKEYKEELKLAIETEKPTLLGREIPFEVESDNFVISDVKIAEISDYGSIKVSYLLTAKNPLDFEPYSKRYSFNIKFMDKDDKSITSQKQTHFFQNAKFGQNQAAVGDTASGIFYVGDIEKMQDLDKIVFYQE